MEDKFTQGQWRAVYVHPTMDGSNTWRDNPPRVDGPNSAIAQLVTQWKSDDEIKANTHLVAAAPAMARALAVVALNPRIRAYLKANDSKALDQAIAALEDARVLS